MPQFESHFFSSLIFWEVVSFAILLFVLYKFAFPGILSALEEREKKIKDSLDQAEASPVRGGTQTQRVRSQAGRGGEGSRRNSGSGERTGAAAYGRK